MTLSEVSNHCSPVARRQEETRGSSVVRVRGTKWAECPNNRHEEKLQSQPQRAWISSFAVVLNGTRRSRTIGFSIVLRYRTIATTSFRRKLQNS
jgi:hypothetical protein